jgi:hypothetical protein
MKKAPLRVIYSIYLVLAVLLCSILMLTPSNANANSISSVNQQESLYDNAEASQILFAGDIASGEVEGLIQLGKSQLLPFIKVYFQLLYPQSNTIGAAPNDYPASKGDCGLHTILTKGP